MAYMVNPYNNQIQKLQNLFLIEYKNIYISW